MKRIFVLIAISLFGQALSAQDIITKMDGTDIQAKVTEVGKEQISYKKFSNLEGPSYTMDLAEILMITYENGEREIYNVNTSDTADKGFLPQGVMTYNPWSGKVSVGGETIENEMLSRYFTPDDLHLYQTGKTLSTVGGIIGIVGAFPFGYGAGYLVGWKIGGGGTPVGEYVQPYKAAKVMTLVGGVVMTAGLIIGFTGESKRKTAINNYNSTLAFRPTWQFGATPSGVGLALVF